MKYSLQLQRNSYHARSGSCLSFFVVSGRPMFVCEYFTHGWFSVCQSYWSTVELLFVHFNMWNSKSIWYRIEFRWNLKLVNPEFHSFILRPSNRDVVFFPLVNLTWSSVGKKINSIKSTRKINASFRATPKRNLMIIKRHRDVNRSEALCGSITFSFSEVGFDIGNQ